MRSPRKGAVPTEGTAFLRRAGKFLAPCKLSDQATSLEAVHTHPSKRIRFDALHTIGPSIGRAAESCIP